MKFSPSYVPPPEGRTENDRFERLSSEGKIVFDDSYERKLPCRFEIARDVLLDMRNFSVWYYGDTDHGISGPNYRTRHLPDTFGPGAAIETSTRDLGPSDAERWVQHETLHLVKGKVVYNRIRLTLSCSIMDNIKGRYGYLTIDIRPYERRTTHLSTRLTFLREYTRVEKALYSFVEKPEPSNDSMSVVIMEEMMKRFDEICYDKKTFGRYLPTVDKKRRWYRWPGTAGRAHLYANETSETALVIGERVTEGERLGYVHVPHSPNQEWSKENNYIECGSKGYIGHVMFEEGADIHEQDRLFLVCESSESLEETLRLVEQNSTEDS